MSLPMAAPTSFAGLSRRAVLAAAAGAVVARHRAFAQDSSEVVTLGGVGQQPGQWAREPIVIGDRVYDAYIDTAMKYGQYFGYTCEFDASWMVLSSFGVDVTLDDQVAIVGLDQSVEPYYVDEPDGVKIYGGDIARRFSGDYRKNFLARSTGKAIRKVFEQHGLRVRRVDTREELETVLLRGRPVWIKATVDFKPWVPATWVSPTGRTFPTVLGNDHAVVVIGFNAEVVVIRDPLGPTDTNWERAFEYEVPWDQFLAVWEAQAFDGLAVGASKR